MTEKELTYEIYKALQTDLLRNSHRNPYCPIYEKELSLEGECYTLFIQLDRHNKVYLLYALRSVFESDGRTLRYDMITNNNVLAALMELLVYQTKDKTAT